MGKARMAVSTDLIERLLHMPSSSHIVAAEMGGTGRELVLTIEGPDVPDSADTGGPTVIHTPESFTWNWPAGAEPSSLQRQRTEWLPHPDPRHIEPQ